MKRNGIVWKKYIADLLTGTRIAAACLLLFIPAGSACFPTVYLCGGVSDMLDGPAARRFGVVGKHGALFDSIADLVFAAVCLIKLLPAADVGIFLLCLTGVIAILRVCNAIFAKVVLGKIVFFHTTTNRLAGGLLFLLPFAGKLVCFRALAALVCAVALFATVQEGCRIRRQAGRRKGVR